MDISMMTKTLISFSIEYRRGSRGEAPKFCMDFHGYFSYSHYGRYVSRKEGFLDGMKYIRYSIGAVHYKDES